MNNRIYKVGDMKTAIQAYINKLKVKEDEYKKYVEHWGDPIDPINYKLYSIETDMPCFHPDNRLFTKEEFINKIKTDDEFAKTWKSK
jgi:hypothetical protein